MLEWKPAGPEDKELLTACYKNQNLNSASESFGNLILWSSRWQSNIVPLGERMGLEFVSEGDAGYSFPFGKGPLIPAIEALREDAREKGRPFSMVCVTSEECAELEAAMPGQFEYEDERSDWDYIYSVESFATLSGKKLHGKRNHCNHFEATHAWYYEPLRPSMKDECMEVLKIWGAENGGIVEEERLAIEGMFNLWDEIGVIGGVLYADDEPVAFTMAERIREDTADVHFEKAKDIPGAYPMIAREFARQLQQEMPEILWLNREEDMGHENLRRAKEEWFPDHMLEKFTVTERRNA